MDEDSNEDLFDCKDLRKRKDKKRQHKNTKEKEECTKESFKKMKEEIIELRKKEAQRAIELEQLKQKIQEKESEKNSEKPKEEFALGFDKNEYLSKGFIESAQWINNVLSKNMIEKMNTAENQERFQVLLLAKISSKHLGVRACARFNRGEECKLGKWHTTHKLDGLWTKHGPQQQQHQHDQPGDRHIVKRNEIRLHICTLCLDALGSANGHSVLECPWILKKNWNS